MTKSNEERKFYTAIIKTNVLGNVYIDRTFNPTLDESKQVAFSEKVKENLQTQGIEKLVRYIKLYATDHPQQFRNITAEQLETLTAELSIEEANLSIYTVPDSTSLGRDFYRKPYKNEKLIELMKDLKQKQDRLEEIEDDISALEREKDDLEDEIASVKQEIEDEEEVNPND